jgi:hypothetical protein
MLVLRCDDAVPRVAPHERPQAPVRQDPGGMRSQRQVGEAHAIWTVFRIRIRIDLVLLNPDSEAGKLAKKELVLKFCHLHLNFTD